MNIAILYCHYEHYHLSAYALFCVVGYRIVIMDVSLSRMYVTAYRHKIYYVIIITPVVL